MRTPQPAISLEQATIFLAEHYGLSAQLKFLYGDRDLNYFVKGNEGEFLLKISLDAEGEVLRSEQNRILDQLDKNGLSVAIPKLIKAKNGRVEVVLTEPRYLCLRLYTWINGRLWSEVNPHNTELRHQLGEAAGRLNQAMSELDTIATREYFKWDLAQCLWTEEHAYTFDPQRAEWVRHFQHLFVEQLPAYKQLRKQVIHNDLNDYNIVVSKDVLDPKLGGFIDFGDACYSQSINELAILITYGIMGAAEPLGAACDIVQAYHQFAPILPEELPHLYTLVGMRLVTSVVVSHERKQENPEDQYLTISEQPAWKLMEAWFYLSPDLAHYSFRNACGLEAHPNKAAFDSWVMDKQFDIRDIFPTETEKTEVALLDLKPSSLWSGSRHEFNDLELFEFRIDRLQAQHPNSFIAGGYLEPRPLYTSTSYDREGNQGPESRTVHLGVDFWLPAGTPVHALFDGEIYTTTNDAGYKEYGGLIILKHQEDGLEFFTLHGHLSAASPDQFKVGDKVKKGQQIGVLGDPEENGVWSPHLHFQIILNMLDYIIDFPGVGYASEVPVWKSLCPNPNLLFKQSQLKTQYDPSNEDLLKRRKQSLGKSLSLSYDQPLQIVRGDGPYLMDPWARKYLDTVNNVAHVGHEHPKVARAAQKQISVLNTNTRYLHPAILEFADALRKKLPPHLEVIYLVNSGSEANELALRMAYTLTQSKEVLALEMGYHGNTNAVVDVSSYKFDRKGGSGKPDQTHLLPLPDPFRGTHRGPDAGMKYARYAKEQLEAMDRNGLKPAAFIHESILSCGGQIVPPADYFPAVYASVRDKGGLCIADEVQTGFGRVGSHFWAFELFGLKPDIVTMGKPAGNGHPLGIVACTREVANGFTNGMEFFNTFGGNPVSSRIGQAVLEVIDQEDLQLHAKTMGDYLKTRLAELQRKHTILADIRGEGLFLGVELCDKELNPLTKHTHYLVNRMKDFGILTSSDGPAENVLKIKPPLVFGVDEADWLINTLDQVLSEDNMQLAD